MLLWLFAASALFSCNVDNRPLIAAHRGGMDSGHPENTLPAFLHAGTGGADVLELDLRVTRDGEIVVLHDRYVDRTTDGHGPVSALTLTEVKRLDTGNGTRIPSLAEVLEGTRALDVELLYDVKRTAHLDHAAIVSATRKLHDLNRVIFGVRSLDDRAEFARAQPGLRFLGFVPDPDSIDTFLDAGVEAIRLWPGWVDSDTGLVARLRQRGARVWVTTGVASIDQLGTLVQLGVDVLLTDHPLNAARAFRCR